MYSLFGAVEMYGSRQVKFFTWQMLLLSTAAPAVLAVAPTAMAVMAAQTTAMVRLMCPPLCWRNRRRDTPGPAARWSVRRAARRPPAWPGARVRAPRVVARPHRPPPGQAG